MKKILIVDDDSVTRGLLREMLGSKKYEVLEAEDGQQALEMLHKQKMDLLIADRSMPRLGGLELLQKLRDDNLQLPTIMISAFGEERLWAEAIGLGARDYIVKPFKQEDVLHIVEKTLKPRKKND